MTSNDSTYHVAALQEMVDNFGERLTVVTVRELAKRNAIFVEDGNHGENRPRQNEFAETGVAFVRPPDLKDGRVDFENCGRINQEGFSRVRKGIARRGDIILTHRATVGRIAITDDEAPEVFVTNPGTTVWRSTDAELLDQRYLYCFMRSSSFMDQLWAQVGNNSTFDYVSLTQQRGLFVAFPPLNEQKAIARSIGALDNKIELNRRMNRTLEAMAQAIFKSWFVDFEPVKAKAAAKAAGASPAAIERAAMAAIAGRSIEEAIAEKCCLDDLSPSNRESLAQTAALFPDAFQASELGEIPEGWSEGKLGDIARNYRVGVNPETVPLETPYVGLEHIEKLNFSLSDWGSASDVESQKSQFTRSDFLFGKLRPYFHKVCYPSMDGICSTDILVIRPSCTDYFGFVGCQIFQPEFVEYANVRSTGTRMPRANWKDMANFQIAVPPSILAAKLNELAIKKWMLCSSNVAQSGTLAQLRDTLLPKLLSGKLSVRAAQTKTEEALT